MERNKCHDDNFTECYRKYSEKVLRYIKKIVKDYDVAEELTHETFVKLYVNADVIEPSTERTKNYIFKIARYTAIDECKRQSREEVKRRQACFEDVLLDDKFFDNIENIFIEGEVVSTLNDAIESLNEDEKSMYIKRVVYGKSRVSVAREGKISTYRVKKIENDVQRILLNLLRLE